MSYHKRIGIIGAVCAIFTGMAHGAVVLVDDFNSYTLTSGTNYIQVQNPLWSRFGTATTDGISSIAAGVGGTEGASYSVSWASATAGNVRYTFSATQNLATLTDITLDLNTSVAVAGTTVSVQIRSGSTYFQSSALSLTNTSYTTFDFSTLTGNMTKIQGTATYDAVLGAVDSIVFVYNNTGGTGSQQIRFDNFSYTTSSVPEPGSAALMGLAGVMVTGYYVRRRKANA